MVFSIHDEYVVNVVEVTYDMMFQQEFINFSILYVLQVFSEKN